MALRIIEFLKIPINASILDPCCGTGNFIISAKYLGYNNLYGSDIDKGAVDFCKKNSGISNINIIDSLSNSGDIVLKKIGLREKVDFVIGNPPYVPISKDITINTSDYLFLRNVKDSGSNLFIAAIYRAFELVKVGGIISYIIPKNFLHVSSYSILRRFLLSEKRIKSIIDLGAYFKNVRGEQIVITIANEYSPNNYIELFSYREGQFVANTVVPQNFYSDEILLFSNEYDFEIYKKLKSSYKKLGDICTGYVGRGKSKSPNAIAGKDNEVLNFSIDEKKYFLRGFADVTGYIRRSNCYFNRYEHRVYLEIPNNWQLVIDICNLLKSIDIPIQNIDWAHPNMRDGYCKKYNEGNFYFWKKEHQIKIWANEFLPIGFGVLHKQQALEMYSNELIAGYKKVGKIPSNITHRYYWDSKRKYSKKKMQHPCEEDEFIPEIIRGKHFNSWIEIASELGYVE